MHSKANALPIEPQRSAKLWLPARMEKNWIWFLSFLYNSIVNLIKLLRRWTFVWNSRPQLISHLKYVSNIFFEQLTSVTMVHKKPRVEYPTLAIFETYDQSIKIRNWWFCCQTDKNWLTQVASCLEVQINRSSLSGKQEGNYLLCRIKFTITAVKYTGIPHLTRLTNN